MKIQNIWLVLVLLLALSATVRTSLWNQLISFNGFIQQNDFATDSLITRNSKFYQQPYRLSLLSDSTFEFEVESNDNKENVAVEGSICFNQDISLNSNSYELKTTSMMRLRGDVSYETGWGVAWRYSLRIEQIGLKIQRSQARYTYFNIALLLVFGVTGLFIFSIDDRSRVKILYNLRKRTHPIILMLVILKASWALSCFLIMGYGSMIALSIWVMFFLYGIYLFSLSPSIIHLLYLISAAQKGLSDIESYKNRTSVQQLAIVIGSLLTFIFVFIVSFGLHKGILFYYIMSLSTVFIYVYSCKIKKFAFGSFIIYDAFLMFILSIFSLYLPVGNFVLVSYKQMVLFWNYFIFIFAFGMIFMKRFISNEIVEEIQLSQYSTNQSQKYQTESQRRQQQENRMPQSSQQIEK